VPRLIYGDNLEVLRALPAASVDLAYLDPPFHSRRDYSAVFRAGGGAPAHARVPAFADSWRWTPAADVAVTEALAALPPAPAALLGGIAAMLAHAEGPRAPLPAYLAAMAIRLVEVARVLKPSGQLVLHCDPAAGHHLRLLLDAVLGPRRFLDEIVWRYRTSSGAPGHRLHRNHDLLFRYGNGPAEDLAWTHPRDPWPEATLRKWQRDEAGRVYRRQTRTGRRYYVDPAGKLADDVWEHTLASRSRERLGYPTQKPLWLLDRIVRAASRPGDVVLDPFAGGGTTAVAAQAAGRDWIAVDAAAVAVALTRRRLARAVPGLAVEGFPADAAAAAALRRAAPAEHAAWACDLLGAAPHATPGGEVEGRLVFADGCGIVTFAGAGEAETGAAVERLRARLDAGEAALGVLVCEAAAAAPGDDRLHVVGVDDLLAGRGPVLPAGAEATFGALAA
jgi:site-specific DNA-methyltransferase (adenine-specific)